MTLVLPLPKITLFRLGQPMRQHLRPGLASRKICGHQFLAVGVIQFGLDPVSGQVRPELIHQVNKVLQLTGSALCIPGNRNLRNLGGLVGCRRFHRFHFSGYRREVAGDNPHRALAEIRKGLTDGTTELELREASRLAMVALTEVECGKPAQRQPTSAEIRAEYKGKIARADELGLDNQAARLRSVLENVDKKEAAERERVAKIQAENKKRAIEQQEENLWNYTKQYEELKQHFISEMTRWGRMSSEDAEAQFMKIQHPRIEASLRRTYGL